MHQTLSRDLYEVIVVDDGSTDQTEQIVKDMQLKYSINLKYIKQKNKGPGAARNTGVNMSSGQIVAFIDDDCIADKNWLKELYYTFVKHKYKIVGVEGKVVTIPDKVTVFSHFITNESGGKYYTCNLAVKRSVFVRSGGFDERYPAFNDDLDLAARLLKYGKIVFNPNAVVIHPPYEKSMKEYIKRIEVYKWDIRLYLKYPNFFVKMKGGNPLLVYLYLLSKNFIDEFIKLNKLNRISMKDFVKFTLGFALGRLYLILLLPKFVYFYIFQSKDVKLKKE